MSATSHGFPSHYTRRLVRLLSLFFALGLGACTSWQPMSVRDIGPSPHPDRIRVTTNDRSEMVANARIVDDTLRGDIRSNTGSVGGTMSVPLNQVRRVERSGYDGGKTKIAAGIILAPVALFLWVAMEALEDFCLTDAC